MGEAYDEEKRVIRRRLSDRRSRLSVSEVARSSAAVCERVQRLPSFAAARHLVLYASIGNEIDPVGIARVAVEAGKTVYYPAGEQPEFVSALPEAAQLLSSTHGKRVLILVPGVAFDECGRRLGRGRGWYDRALTRHPDAVRVGLGYDFQVLPLLPEAPWDIRMHAVVTEGRLLGDLAEENQP